MAADVLTHEPQVVTAGDTWTWQVAFSNYAADTYTLAYVVKGGGGFELQWSASYAVAQTDGSFLVTIPASATAGLGEGSYTFARLVTLTATGARQPSENFPTLARLTVLANPETMSAADAQPYQELHIGYIEAALAGRYVDGMQGYMIGGKQVQFIPPSELRKELASLRAELAAIRSGGTDPLGRTIRFQFDRPTGFESDAWR